MNRLCRICPSKDGRGVMRLACEDEDDVDVDELKVNVAVRDDFV